MAECVEGDIASSSACDDAVECMARCVRSHGLGLLHSLVSSNVAAPQSQSADLCARLLHSGLLKHACLQPKSNLIEIDNLRNQFISNNVWQLFTPPQTDTADYEKYTEGLPAVPPLESFLDLSSIITKDKFFKDLRVGDVLCGRITSVDELGINVRLLCTHGSPHRDLESFKLDVFVGVDDLVLEQEKAVTVTYRKRTFIRAVVKEIYLDSHRIVVSTFETSCAVPLGVIDEELLPSYYESLVKLSTSSSYDLFLRRNPSFKNPTLTTLLCNELRLKEKRNVTSFLPELNERSGAVTRFSKEEFASDLRAKQSYKLAMKSVVRGVEHFKKGHKVEALQLYNKALQVDTQNVEALVARGALHVSQENYVAGIADFETALTIDSTDHNARKYLIETLTAKAKLQTAKKNRPEAKKCYKRILQLDADNDNARKALGIGETQDDKDVIELDTANDQHANGADPLEVQLHEICGDSKLPIGDDLAKSIAGNDELMSKLKSYYKQYSKSKDGVNVEEVEKRNGKRHSHSKGRASDNDDDIVEISPPNPKEARHSTGSYHRRPYHHRPALPAKSPHFGGKTYFPKNTQGPSSAPPKPTKPRVTKEDKKLKKELSDMDSFISQLKNKKEHTDTK